MKLLWIAAAWTAGILLANRFDLHLWQWLILLGLALLGIILFRKNPRICFSQVLIATLYLGGITLCCYPSHSSFPTPAVWNDSGIHVTLYGRVQQPALIKDRSQSFVLNVESLTIGRTGETHPVAGKVLVFAPRLLEIGFDDHIQIYGQLETAPVFETFDYRTYLEHEGIHSLLSNGEITILGAGDNSGLLALIYRLRRASLELIYSLYPDPEASLLAGILVGMEAGIAPDLKRDFNRTGTSHIIAISGFNITIIAAVFQRKFRRWLGFRLGALAALLAVGFYTVLVGADAAVLRAAIMGSLSIMGEQSGRHAHGYAALGAASIIMSMIDPYVIWDGSFQLSFSATIGLLVFSPALENWTETALLKFCSASLVTRLLPIITENVICTLAAQLTTLPLTILLFRQISLSAFLINPVILPLQPGLMITGGLSVITGLFHPFAGQPLAWLAWPFPALTIRLVRAAARLPWPAIPLTSFWRTLLLVLYPIIVFPAAAMIHMPPEKHKEQLLRMLRSLTVCLFLLATILVWHNVNSLPDANLHIYLIDNGNQATVLITSPAGRNVLVGAGDSPIKLSNELGRRLPYLQPELDWWIIGANQDNAMLAIDGIQEHFPVGGILVLTEPGSRNYRIILNEMANRGIPIQTGRPGQQMDLGDDITLNILSTGSDGSALKIQFRELRILLNFGADPFVLQNCYLEPENYAPGVFLLAESGSLAMNPTDWLSRIQPGITLISVEAGNPAGHPAPAILTTLSQHTVLRTDQHGTIHLISDGRRIWAEVERTPKSADETKQ